MLLAVILLIAVVAVVLLLKIWEIEAEQKRFMISLLSVQYFELMRQEEYIMAGRIAAFLRDEYGIDNVKIM